MKKFAQIVFDRVHWVFETSEKQEFAPYIILVDITEQPEIQEGWEYRDGSFIPPTEVTP